MFKQDKHQMNYKLSITHLHEKFRDLYEEERLSLFYTEMFTDSMDKPLRELSLGSTEHHVLESYGLWLLSDILVLGWHQKTFYYGKAKRALLEIPGIGTATVHVLLHEVSRVLSREEDKQRVRDVLVESPDDKSDRYFLHSWAKRLHLEYEHVKHLVTSLRNEQKKGLFVS